MSCQNCACFKCRPPSVLAELRTADGAVHPQLVTISSDRRNQPFRTIIAPQGVYSVTEAIEPTAPAFQERVYRWNGRTRRDDRSMTEVLIFEEELPRPPRPAPEPQLLICQVPTGQWCNACKATHSSLSPRIVRNPKWGK